MANKISDETIEYVGILAKLELSGQEKEDAKADMEKMLDYIDTLNELDTDGIEPMSHVFPVKNVFREDVVTNGDGSAETLANAPLEKDQSFKVPKTIGLEENGYGYYKSYSSRAWKEDQSKRNICCGSRESLHCTD
mgnify:CR=1 FL=1